MLISSHTAMLLCKASDSTFQPYPSAVNQAHFNKLALTTSSTLKPFVFTGPSNMLNPKASRENSWCSLIVTTPITSSTPSVQSLCTLKLSKPPLTFYYAPKLIFVLLGLMAKLMSLLMPSCWKNNLLLMFAQTYTSNLSQPLMSTFNPIVHHWGVPKNDHNPLHILATTGVAMDT
jgi:hypothetical protein